MAVEFKYAELFVTGQPWNKIDLGGDTYSTNVTVRGVFQFDGKMLDGSAPPKPHLNLAFTMLMEVRRFQDNFISKESHATTGQTPIGNETSWEERRKMVGELPVKLIAGNRYKFQLYVNFSVCKKEEPYLVGCGEWLQPAMESQWTFRDSMNFSVLSPGKLE